MPEPNEIQLKITIDGKDAVATLKLTESEIKKLSSQFTPAEANIKKTTSAVTTLGSVSKRDLGIFANQLLYSFGASGKLQGQLSNLATGLATGGVIGAAFAGAAVLINKITEETGRWNSALDSAAKNLIQVKTKLEGIKFRITIEELDAVIKATEESIDAMETKIFTRWAGKLGGVTGMRRGGALIMWLDEALGINSQLTKEEREQLEADRKILENLQDQKLQYEAQALIAERLKKFGAERVDTTKKEVDFEKQLLELRRASHKLKGRGLFTERVDLNSPEFGTEGAVPVPVKPSAISESILQLQLQLDLINSIGMAWQSAGQAGVYALTSQIQLFGQVNSVAEVFLQTLFEIAAQQAILALFNFLSGGIGGVLAGDAMAEGGSGIVTKPTLFLAGENGPESFNFSPLDSLNRSASVPQLVRVEVFGTMEQKGMDMRAVLNQVERNIRSRRSGE